MVKVITFIKRKPGMPVEEFQSYWRTRHPEVVTRLPGVRRYVQSHTLLAAYGTGEAPHDTAVKTVDFLVRKPGMPVEEFQRHWLLVHGPIAAAIPALRRYVQSHTRRSAYEAGRIPTYDGAAITWYDSADAFRAAAAGAQHPRVGGHRPSLLLMR